MHKKLGLVACLVALQGCVAYIPGSVTGAVSDAMTGEEGGRCVASTAKVGDRLTVDGHVMVITHLSGPSSRCQPTGFPMRAVLAPESVVKKNPRDLPAAGV